MLSRHVSAEEERDEWIVLYKDVKPGEMYRVRLNETRTPLLIWGSIDMGGVIVETQWDQRVATFKPGATIPLGNGQLQFAEVPEFLDGCKYTKRNGYAGITRFGVARDQTVTVGFYDWRHMHDGNDSGGWKEQLTSPTQLQKEGWKEVVVMDGRDSDGNTKKMHFYSRDCKSGETFALRNHKYQAPVVFAETPERSSDSPRLYSKSPFAAPESVERGLIGRAAVSGLDGGVIFKYEHGRFFDRSHLLDRFAEQDIEIVLGGYIDVLEDCSVRIYQAGGGVSHDVNTLYLDHRKICTTGDNTDKHFDAEFKLSQGRHFIRWKLTGGTFRSNVLAIVNSGTGALVPILNHGLKSIQVDPDDQILYIEGQQKDWPIPDDWLPDAVQRLQDIDPLEKLSRAPGKGIGGENKFDPAADDAPRPTGASTSREAALKKIKELGGSVEMGDDQVVLKVNLGRSEVTDDDLAHLATFPQLRSIDLARTKVTSDGLRHLKNITSLEELRLYDTLVDNDGLLQLKRLSKLRWLMLKRTNVDGEGTELLQTVLPQCFISWSPRT